jgi:hypothetical protein
VVVVVVVVAGGYDDYAYYRMLWQFLQDSNRIPVSFDVFDYDITAEHVSTEPVMAANLKQKRIKCKNG